MTSEAAPQSASPAEVLVQVMTSYAVPQAIYAATALGIADHLTSDPKSAEALASLTGSDPGALRRLLRALGSAGVVAETEGGFAETALSRCLRRDTEGSVRASVLVAGAEHYRAWGDLVHSVQSGRPAFDHVFGTSCYEYLAEHPDAGRLFDRSMRETGAGQWGVVVDAYDFGAAATIVDVGGGHGALLAALLQANPGAKGILFDLPHVVEGARSLLEQAGVAERCTVKSGSFFEAVPAGGDVYLLARTLFNWAPEQQRLILERCSQAMSPAARLLIAEPLLAESGVSFADAFNDLNLLVLGGGRMLTERDLRTLLAAAGLAVEQVIATPARISLVEAVRQPV